jgi:hypothetical protein
MTTPLTVRIDRTPDRTLSPNSGKHDRTRKPHAKAIRDTAAAATLNALRGGTWCYEGPIMLTVTYGWERGRKRLDWDNATAISKYAIDGVFSRINANDRQVAGIVVHQVRDPVGDGYMVINLEPVTEKTP